MIALLVCLVITGVAVALLFVARASDAARDARARAAELAFLEQTGLAVAAGAYEWSLRGTKQGVSLAIEGRARRPLPGKAPDGDGDVSGTLLELSSQGLDFIVCRKQLTDAIVGALTVPPRRPTGDAAFDARFDVLATEPGPDGTTFVPAHVRDALARMDLQWLRRREGRVEIMLSGLEKNQAGAVVALGVALGQPGSASAGPIDVPDGDRPPPPISIATPLLIAFGSLVAIGPMGTMLFAVFPPAQWLFADIACPDGFSILGTSSTVGASTYYGAVCRTASRSVPLSSLFWVACVALTVSLVACVGLVLSGRRWLAVRGREATARALGSGGPG